MSNTLPHDVDRTSLMRAVYRSDLSSFIQRAFGVTNPATPYVHNWHIDSIAYALEQCRLGKIKRLIITIQPRSMKSICASVVYPAWLLGHDPSTKIIGASYAMELSRKHSLDCRNLMESQFYRSLFPGTILSPSKNTETEFMTTRRGSRYATSVGGPLTGRGGDVLIIDDPLKPEDALSNAARQRQNEWFGNTAYSRLDNKAAGTIIIVTQRLHIEDLVGYVLPLEDWYHLNLPAIEDTARQIQIGPDRFVQRKPGDLLHPERESAIELNKIKAALGNYQFSAQYLQQPIPIDGEIIKWQWFKQYKELPKRMPDDRIVQSWDTASKANELSDYSVCTTWHIQGDNCYLLDVFRERLEFPALKKKAIELFQRFNPRIILIEDRASGTSLIQELKGKGLGIKAIEPVADKVTRMSAQSVKIEAGKVHIPDQAPWFAAFKAELLQFPNGAKDDQVDSLSQLLQWTSDRTKNRARVVKLKGW